MQIESNDVTFGSNDVQLIGDDVRYVKAVERTISAVSALLSHVFVLLNAAEHNYLISAFHKAIQNQFFRTFALWPKPRRTERSHISPIQPFGGTGVDHLTDVEDEQLHRIVRRVDTGFDGRVPQ